MSEGEIRRVVLERWVCSRGHLHKTEVIAQACNERARVAEIRRLERKLGEAQRREAITARREKALQLREAGYTYREVGRAVGRAADPSVPVSVSVARELVFGAKRRRERAALLGREVQA